jgi:5-oxoprolinase (ATP-hydrolysing)
MVSFSIDRGGTFTDIYALHEGRVYTEKLLSDDPENYPDAPSEGIRRLLERILDVRIPRGQIDPAHVKWVRMGTTVATNALLERKGARTALLITSGFEDALSIGYQNRPKLFDLDIKKPSQLYERTVGIDERVVIEDGEAVVEQAPDPHALKALLSELKAEGITSLSVVLMHAYRFDAHEKLIRELAEPMGFENLSLSSEVIPAIKLVDRGDTTTVDAYLTPHIQAYIHTFQQGFASPLEGRKLLFMQSHGGLCEAEAFRGANALLSGPAGGVLGYAKAFYKGTPLIGFDMGGTSTDVSRYDGTLDISYEHTMDGIAIKTPQIEILTTAAGGGSRLFYKNGLFLVGPESSGAHPGPVCYKKGGYLSVTDANLVLGRLRPEFFPRIFGPMQNEPLGLEEAREAFEALTARINEDLETPMCIEEVAMGFLEVANEHMVKPVREISVQQGYDIRTHALAAFGGAGGQHACAVARKLGMQTVHLHRHAGILSAVGLGGADMAAREVQTLGLPLDALSPERLAAQIHALRQRLEKQLGAKENDRPQQRATLNLRYRNVDHTIPVEADLAACRGAFETAHQRIFGFIMPERAIEAAELVVELLLPGVTAETAPDTSQTEEASEPLYRPVYFDTAWIDTPFYPLETLEPGRHIEGPAVILHGTSTILVEPETSVVIDQEGHLEITLHHVERKRYSTQFDPVLLSLFNHRFMSAAEQMGRIYQRTSVSTNIKERLDFSCALFDKRGSLIANAPHIPVHLGSMGYAVRHVLTTFQGDMRPGDSFIINAPFEGGSHLPDITIVTPHFEAGEVAFVTANRGHHADIGGATAGSMPPFSTTIEEEGALFRAMKIVENGTFDEQAVRAILEKAGARDIENNLSDIKAALGANVAGGERMRELWQSYSREVTEAYMEHIIAASSRAVRSMLEARVTQERHASDALDDGSRIDVRIYKEGGAFVFDFSATELQSHTNQNTPFSVTASAVVYTLRAVLGEDLPLNEGFLGPVRIVIAENSLLNPDPRAAVVGGNVTTSQRIVDVLLEAFNVCAGSQGCMNNVSFGDGTFGYYETVGGGSGALEGHDGADAVHTHMTNTRITDAEIIETRYPVIIRRFGIRSNSGGRGRWRGGNGIVRELEFTAPLQLTLITERRVFAPRGAEGGGHGMRGQNLLIRNGRPSRLPSKISLEVGEGDRLKLLTPGGGGYGISER